MGLLYLCADKIDERFCNVPRSLVFTLRCLCNTGYCKPTKSGRKGKYCSLWLILLKLSPRKSRQEGGVDNLVKGIENLRTARRCADVVSPFCSDRSSKNSVRSMRLRVRNLSEGTYLLAPLLDHLFHEFLTKRLLSQRSSEVPATR